MHRASRLANGGSAGARVSRQTGSSSVQPRIVEPKLHDKDGSSSSGPGSNIRVLVRCRGRNKKELESNSSVVVDTSISKTEVAVFSGEDTKSNKVFSVDHVYGPEANQSVIFDEEIAPIVDDCLSGMNCTVFAYGQTGAGKTYTMSGSNQMNGEHSLSPEAGIIPRVILRLFQSLELRNQDFLISCSFMELYNEELRDLFASGDDGRKIRIFDDQQKKLVKVSGLTDIYLSDATSGLNALQLGLDKRHVAATNMNNVSSRSHSIFTITVVTNHQSEYAVKSKINLVDLAGSENIGKSGAENKRAREAGMINQSLLTLGRVINALVDKSTHIPYRESKLTRLLQDSLGGATKTCIIASVGPANTNYEETLSTLEYASRAKNIKNRPQSNVMIGMRTMLKEYAVEMEKLQNDLNATRKKNGVYMDDKNYTDMMAQQQSQKIQLKEQQRLTETLESQLKSSRKEEQNLRKHLLETMGQLQESRENVTGLRGELSSTKAELQSAHKTLQEERSLRKAHENTENELQVIGSDMIKSLGQATKDLNSMHFKLKSYSNYDTQMDSLIEQTVDKVISSTQQVESSISAFDTEHGRLSSDLKSKLGNMLESEKLQLEDASNLVQDSLNDVEILVDNLLGSLRTSQSDYDEFLHSETSKIRDLLVRMLSEGLQPIRSSTQEMMKKLQLQIDEAKKSVEVFLNDMSIRLGNMQDQHKLSVRRQLANVANQSQELDSLINDIKQQKQFNMRSIDSMIRQESKAACERRDALLSTITQAVDMLAKEDKQSVDMLRSNALAMLEHDNIIESRQKDMNQVLKKSSSDAEDLLKLVSTSFSELHGQFGSTSTNSFLLNNVDAAAKELGSIGTSIEEHIISASNNTGQLDGFIKAARGQNQTTHEQLGENARQLSTRIQNSFQHLITYLRTPQNRGQYGIDEFTEELSSAWDLQKGNSLSAVSEISEHAQQLVSEFKKAQKQNSNVPVPEFRDFDLPAELPKTNLRPESQGTGTNLLERQPLEEVDQNAPQLNSSIEFKVLDKQPVSREPIIPRKRRASPLNQPRAQRRHVN